MYRKGSGWSRGCGAPLQWCSLPSPSPEDVCGYYRCANAPDCSFTELPPARLLSPIVALEALSPHLFKV